MFLSDAYARYGVVAGKAELTHSPNWIVIIVFSIIGIFSLSFIKEVSDDYKDVEEPEDIRKGHLLKIIGIATFVVSIYLVFNAAF